MVWPSNKVSQELKDSKSFDNTILGKYYDSNGHVRADLWRTTDPAKRAEILFNLSGWGNIFSHDVIIKIASANRNTIRKLIYGWRGIENVIIFANPALRGTKVRPIQHLLFRWWFSYGIHSYSKACKEWKKLTLHMLHYVAESPVRQENPFPRTLPGGRMGEFGWRFGPQWNIILPWLLTIDLNQMLGIATRDKQLLEHVGYFVQTRFLPSPPIDDRRFEEEYLEWSYALTRTHTWNKDMEAETIQATNRFIKFQDENNKGLYNRIRPHISLSASGCYENPRSKGGRALFFMHAFITEYLIVRPVADQKATTWWGAPLSVRKGTPKFFTMCREFELREDIDFLATAFRNEFAPGGYMYAQLAGEDSEVSLSEPIFGIDRVLPLQLFQFAIEKCVEKRLVPGPASRWEGEEAMFDRPFKREHVKCKGLFIAEPGNKVRVLCEAPACVTIFLQPFAHWMEGIIKSYPMLISAFTKGYKGWDFTKLLMRKDHKSWADPEAGIGTFDLSQATNNLNQALIKSICLHLIEHYATSADEIFYLTQALELLLAPRRIEVRKNPPRTLR